MVGSRRLSDDVIEISGGKQPSSNVYLIISKNMLVDLGNKENSEEITNELNKYTKLADIKTIVFTHLHYDHTGNPLLLKDAEYQAVLMSHLAASDPAIRAHAQLVDALLRNPDLEAYKTKVRHCVSGNVIFGDIFEQNLGNPMELCGLADVVTSNFAVESATGDMAQWEKGMRNIAALVKVGGFLAVAAIRNAGWYLVGDKKVPAVQIDESAIANFCAAERFTIVETRVLTGSNQDKHGYDGVVFALAKKE